MFREKLWPELNRRTWSSARNQVVVLFSLRLTSGVHQPLFVDMGVVLTPPKVVRIPTATRDTPILISKKEYSSGVSESTWLMDSIFGLQGKTNW